MAAPSARLLLTGANGRTGRAVLTALVRAGVPVRAFIRNDAQRETLIGLGAAECALGDMDDPPSIAAALAGCRRLIHIGPPMHPREVQMTQHFIDAAHAVRLDQFVYYSVMHPLRTEVRHHHLKLQAEQRLIASGLPYTILQPMRYMQHLESIWKQVCDEGVHGMPFNTEARFSVVDLLDLAQAAALVVTQPSHLYATYELAGPQALSQSDMAVILARVLQRPVLARAVPLEQMQARARAAGASADRIEQMTAMNHHYDEHGFVGNGNVLAWLLGREPTRFEEYVRRLLPPGR